MKKTRIQMLEIIPQMIAQSPILQSDQELRESIEQSISEMSDEDLHDLILQLQAEDDFVQAEIVPLAKATSKLEDQLNQLEMTAEKTLQHGKRQFKEDIEGLDEEEEAERLLGKY